MRKIYEYFSTRELTFDQSARTNFGSGPKTFSLPTLSCLNCVYCLWYKLIAWMAFRNNGKSWLRHESSRLKKQTHFPLFCHFPWKCQRVIELGKSIENHEVWMGRRQNPAYKHFHTRPNWGLHKHLFSPKCICLPCRYKSGTRQAPFKMRWRAPGKERAKGSGSQTKLVTCSLLFISFGNSETQLSTEHSNFARSAPVELFIKMQLNFSHDAWLARQLHSNFNYSRATWGKGTKSH